MLDDKLEELAQSDWYPFHMPGHKRSSLDLGDPYQIDITEIEGFDDLHQPQDSIKEAMDQLATLYKATKSYLMINGSTGGNLAAIFAATKPGDTIIMGRNCHKSIYHGAMIRQLHVAYTIPQVTNSGFISHTPLEEYEKAIVRHPEAVAVVVTSPSYEGFIENVAAIASLAHEHHMVVIVDCAHGAHLGLDSRFPKSPVELGADITIMSLHKTLPALTQTAVLHYKEHVNERQQPLLSVEAIETYLGIFQTSSPSYVLMSSVCKCIKFLQQDNIFTTYLQLLEDFYKKCQTFLHLDVRTEENQDPSKIVIDVSRCGMTGYELSQRLREEDHIELEMASFSYALAMTSVMDGKEGFYRLFAALSRIDKEITNSQEDKAHRIFKKELPFALNQLYQARKKVMESWEAEVLEKEWMSFDGCLHKVSAKEVALYPPGVPLLVPGEEIDEQVLEILKTAKQAGLKITGAQIGVEDRFSVVI